MHVHRSPVMLPSQWVSLRQLSLHASIAGFVLVFVFLFIWLCDPEKRKHRLVIIFGMSSMITSITFLVGSSLDPEKTFCASNSVPISASDGFTFCYFQALVLTYFSLVNNLSWFFLAFDVFLKIAWGHDKKRDHTHHFMPFIFGLPIISVIYAVVAHSYGFSTTSSWCFNVNIPTAGMQTDQDLGYVFIPMTIITGLGSILMMGVVYSATKIIYRANIEHLLANMKVLKTPIAFVVCGSLCWFSLIYYRYVYYQLNPKVRALYIEWIGCVFRNFDGTQGSWVEACGKTSPHMYKLNPIRWQLICLAGQSIFVSCIYLSSFAITALVKLFGGSVFCFGVIVSNIVETVEVVRRRSTITMMQRSVQVVPVESSSQQKSNDAAEGHHHVKPHDVELGHVPYHPNATNNNNSSSFTHNSPIPGAHASGYESEDRHEEAKMDAAKVAAALRGNEANRKESTGFGKSLFNMDSAAEYEGLEEEQDDLDSDVNVERLQAIQNIVNSTMGDTAAISFKASQRYEAPAPSSQGVEAFVASSGSTFGRAKSKLKSNRDPNSDEKDFNF
jgi:hypothetical protein